MKIEHIAIWANDLEKLKHYYHTYFGGIANSKYENPTTNFSSYFISFDTGCRLEIMKRPDIPANQNDTITAQYLGLIHFSIEVDSKAEVDKKAIELRNAGFHILRGPRTSGDGYYEFETLDPENNRIEVVAAVNNKSDK